MPEQQQDVAAKLQQTTSRAIICIKEEGGGADLSTTQLAVEENQKLDYKLCYAEA
jgi:hypothetical protein